MKVAYCTGFWCTNIGNGFFSMGVEYALKKVLGEENVTVVSDLQTYTTGYGRRLYPHRNQLEYLSGLDVDYLVLAGPVLSRYFLQLWGEILRRLQRRGVGYVLLSAGTMKMDPESDRAIREFFESCPPYALSSRDRTVYEAYGKYARHAYDGICFSFFLPQCYHPAGLSGLGPYAVYNFDKIEEPLIRPAASPARGFSFGDGAYEIVPAPLEGITARTDRFTDALVYAMSLLPAPKRPQRLGPYRIVRTDHRFHPHYRRKIYRHPDSFGADLPYGYLNLYANAALTLSDRVHACAATLAYGHSAMMFAKTGRAGLLERVGAGEICRRPVKLDLPALEEEKQRQLQWLAGVLRPEAEGEHMS